MSWTWTASLNTIGHYFLWHFTAYEVVCLPYLIRFSLRWHDIDRRGVSPHMVNKGFEDQRIWGYAGTLHTSKRQYSNIWSSNSAFSPAVRHHALRLPKSLPDPQRISLPLPFYQGPMTAPIPAS